MKRILLLFLLILGACGDQEILPSSVSDFRRPLPPSLQPSPMQATCEWKFFVCNQYDPAPNTQIYGQWIQETLITNDPPNAWSVKPYIANFKVTNEGANNRVAFKKDGNHVFQLWPGQAKTFTITMNCDCLTDCPYSISNMFTWTIEKVFGTDANTQIRFEFTGMSPSHTYGTLTYVSTFTP